MSPKEKAIELVNSFYNNAESRNKIGAFDEDLHQYNCKQCALIAVDELIKYHDEFMDVVRYELPSNIVASIPYKYWDEVKQEIEKL